MRNARIGIVFTGALLRFVTLTADGERGRLGSARFQSKLTSRC
jgi:hypothetical protein